MKSATRVLTVLVGAVVGFAVGYLPDARASRSSTGTYTLPTGNPVVAGTTISSTVHNATMSDVATELTSSLDRNGRGGMLAPLQCTAGTAAAPSLTFTSDTDTGVYRVGANNLGLTTNGVKRIDVADTLTQFSTDAGVSGNLLVNGSAVAGTLGVGSPNGSKQFEVRATVAGASLAKLQNLSNTGFSSFDFYDNSGTLGMAVGYANGSASLAPGCGFIAMANGNDLCLTDGSAVKVRFADDTGAMDMQSATNPASTTAYSETLTPKNIVKAWATITTNGAGSATINDGFNVTSATLAGTGTDFVRLTFASAFSSTNYACLVTENMDGVATVHVYSAGNRTTTRVDIGALNGSASQVQLDSESVTFYVMCLGAQ